MIGWWITVAAAAAVAVLFAVVGVIFKQVFTRKEPKQFGGDEPCLAPKWSEIEAEIAEGVRKIRGVRLEKITVNSFDGLQLAGRYFAPEGRLRGVVVCAHGYHSSYGNDFGAEMCIRYRAKPMPINPFIAPPGLLAAFSIAVA